MVDWLELDKVTILKEKDKYGNRYLNQFILEYKKVFQSDVINISCESCLNNHYNKFIKHLEKMANSKDKQTKAVLLKKYEGIQLCFGSKEFITNATMTQKQAIYLLEKHPRGEKLFQVLPDVEEKTHSQLKKAELVEKYPNIDPSLNKENFLKAIEAAKETK